MAIGVRTTPSPAMGRGDGPEARDLIPPQGGVVPSLPAHRGPSHFRAGRRSASVRDLERKEAEEIREILSAVSKFLEDVKRPIADLINVVLDAMRVDRVGEGSPSSTGSSRRVAFRTTS